MVELRDVVREFKDTVIARFENEDGKIRVFTDKETAKKIGISKECGRGMVIRAIHRNLGKAFEKFTVKTRRVGNCAIAELSAQNGINSLSVEGDMEGDLASFLLDCCSQGPGIYNAKTLGKLTSL